ncbi:MAG: 3-hydroxyacyl-CoA dehydrogenase family protein [Deltaproteobacteria bacterium]|nr:3-hydroxyacyl-CoA dehydrogenase family protein [Deltaproteobacteria bacterium]
MSISKIGVIGAGVMGGGIAQSCAVAGYQVVCSDIAADALERGKQDAASGRFGIGGAVAIGKLSAADADSARARITWTTDFAAAASCDLVIECVPERLDLKMRVFRDLDAAAPEHAILASNTSGFPLAAIAGATGRPGRAIVWHWASPAYVMKFAEIVTFAQTDPVVTETVVEVAKRCGKNPIVVKDQPLAWGFVANRIYGAMLREAARVVEEGVATHEQVNALMVDCFRWPVGPFAMVKGATTGWKK